MRRIDRDQLKNMLTIPYAKVIDVRDPSSYEQGHIPGAVNIPVSDPGFVKSVEAFTGDSLVMIVLYCGGPGCTASAEAGERLQQEDFDNVFLFEGGMEEWQAAGQHVATGSETGSRA